VSLRDEFTEADRKTIYGQLTEIEGTLLHRAIRARGEELVRSAETVLFAPSQSADAIRIAQGERKAAIYATMIVEDLLRIFGPLRKPRREE
jgi:hypothetical protein